MLFNIVDFLCAVVVVAAVFLKFKNRRVWAVYAVACFGYVCLGYVTELYGLLVLNIIVGSLAVRNFRKDEKNE